MPQKIQNLINVMWLLQNFLLFLTICAHCYKTISIPNAPWEIIHVTWKCIIERRFQSRWKRYEQRNAVGRPGI